MTYAAAILELLEKRGPGKTICPSDVARALHPTGWRAHLDDVRAAAARLVASGRVVITQKGREVDLATARGPIRIKKR